MKPPWPAKGGLVLPQNQNTEIILLGVGLKTAKRLIYSNRTLKYATREVEQLKNMFLKMGLKTNKQKYVSVGIKLWPQGHKVLTLTQHQYYPILYNVYFTGL